MSELEPPEPVGNRNAAEAVTWQVRVAAAWTWRLLLLGFGLYVLARIFGRVELVAMSFVLSLFLVAILHPLERRLHALIPKPSSLSAAITLLIGIAVLGGIGYFVVWQISTHSDQLNTQITDFVDKTEHWLKTGPLHVKSKDLDNLTTKVTDALKNHQGTLISGAIQTVRTVVEALTAFLLILLSTFFLLRDGSEVWDWVVRLFPRAAHRRLDHAGRVGWHTFGGYMRGQLIIALFHGITISIVLVIMRVPLAAALGVLIFLGSFVPLVGLTVTGALAVAVSLLEHGVTAAVVVAIAIIVLVQVEGHVLQPLVMSRSVEVHPLAIALAVITGTTLAGIVGALLAVPFVAFVNSTVHALRGTPPNPPAGEDFPLVDETENEPDDEDDQVPPTR
ncbi:MAG TPA: AI-2E family transporter [Jatrophihabitantaceae bacterium]|jgi:predicted PurR-regulated permease PerM|nr:AI-2E family transporter [Jatrophihabitantaceae bacterium]